MYNIKNKNVMKKHILKTMIWVPLLLALLSSCGNDYLETDYHKGIDVDKGLTSVANLETALSGTYYRLFYYGFAGNYSTSIGDIPTDLTYWNTSTGHWQNLYTYTFSDTDLYLGYIWQYGYKVADNSARIIKAAKGLYDGATTSEKNSLDRIMAEAYALRGYSMLVMANIYCHQIKVAGTDHSASPGMVLIDEPIPPYTDVERATLGETYQTILSDFNNSLSHFAAAGYENSEKCYITSPAVKGFLARTYLYMENWTEAASKAIEAINDSGLSMVYTESEYKALFGGGSSNKESMFYLAIDATNNWSANSCGTLWSTYSFSPSPKLLALYSADDIRKVIMDFDEGAPVIPTYLSGKFAAYASGNPANATNYLVNIPEMYLIAAEAYANKGDVSSAATMLLNVARRDPAITSVADLPATKSEILEFIKDERARELFQEGLRLWDLRRWDEPAQVYAYEYPNITFRYNNYRISDLVFPIPADEINANFGVTQNDWSSTLPK